MAEQIDLAAITAGNVTYQAIDKEEKAFYQLLEDKEIEPTSGQDYQSIERCEQFIAKFVRNLENIMKESAFPSELKTVMTARLTIDTYGGFGEKFGFDPMMTASLFGKSHDKKMQQAIKDIKL